MIVCPWAKEVNHKVKFGESAPFIFTMEDETFERWMEVYELSRKGGIIAYNGMKQSKVYKIADDPCAWQLNKKFFRNCQGCSDTDLRKVADYLLDGRLSIQKDRNIKVKKTKTSTKSSDIVVAPTSTKARMTLEDFCTKKKHKVEFEAFLLILLNGDQSTRSELKSLTKAARKLRVQRMKDHYKIDAATMKQLREALSLNDVLKKSLLVNVSFETLKALIDPSFYRLVEGIKNSVDIHGNRIVKSMTERLVLRSIKELRSEEFPNTIISENRNLANFIYLDCSVEDDIRPFNSEFYGKFFNATSEIGKKPNHVVVIIAPPVETFLARRELDKYRQYIAVDTHYIQNLSSAKPSIHRADTKRRLIVTYAYYSAAFDKLGDPTVLENLLTKGFNMGNLVDFEETSDIPSTSKEKMMSFYEKLVSQFVQSDGVSVCFSEGKKLVQSIMVSFLIISN